VALDVAHDGPAPAEAARTSVAMTTFAAAGLGGDALKMDQSSRPRGSENHAVPL
jgi:hypothetical protein